MKPTASLSRTLLSAIVFAACVSSVSAQNLAEHFKFVERVRETENVNSLKADMFGDQLNMKNGGVSFSTVDIDIPGNSAIPVQLRRTRQIVSIYPSDDTMAGFGVVGGAVDVPYLTTTTSSAGWLGGNGTEQTRCSQPQAPSHPQFMHYQFYSGYWMHLPGQGEEALLTNPASGLPAPSGTYPWLTKSMARLRCKSSTANGQPGEAFIAITPDGLTYTFDWQLTEPTSGLSRTQVGFTHAVDREIVYFLATKIEDRFGNSVQYGYDGNGRLQTVTANDGRHITLTWSGDKVTSAASSVGTWTYAYTTNSMTVTRPDASQWKHEITSGSLEMAPPDELSMHTLNPNDADGPRCPLPGGSSGGLTYTVTHPSGAVGSFVFDVQRHFRHNLPKTCVSYLAGPSGSSQYYMNYLLLPHFSDSFTLTTKTITGPGVDPLTWSYKYGIGAKMLKPFDEWCAASPTNCPLTIASEVRGPANTFERHHIGAWFDRNEGQLFKLEKGEEFTLGSPVIHRTTTYEYIDHDTAPAQVFAERAGEDMRGLSDDTGTSRFRPVVKTTINQDGVDFVSEVQSGCTVVTARCFDVTGRPTRTRRFSADATTGAVRNSRTDDTVYYDSVSPWVRNQVASETNVDLAAVLFRTEYNSLAQPVRHYAPGTTAAPGPLVQTLTYHPQGTLATIKDGRNNTTSLNSYVLGIPQSVLHADGTTESAVVNTAGRITSWTNEENHTTNYEYDAMGRLSKSTPPLPDVVSWSPTTFAFTRSATAAMGLSAGHWRRTTTRGNYRKVVYYDAMWRPVIEHEYDNANLVATQRFKGWKYDYEGRTAFEGYPLASATAITSFANGATMSYDALGRPKLVSTSSEHGPLQTTYTYLPGFLTRVTNPRSYSTLTGYQTFDSPDTDAPVSIVSAEGRPEQQTTTILRDALGKTKDITRAGTYGGSPVTLTRQYVYDPQHRLCKRMDPEVGQTLFRYDAAGNVAWTARFNNAAFISQACNDLGDTNFNRINYTYDVRNRRTLEDYVDTATPDVVTSYYPDGAVQSITQGPVTLSYAYNKLGKLTSERMQHGTIDWTTLHSYNAHGDVASLTYPDNGSVAFAPNALGQATQAGTFATAASYFPNGALKQFTYGNNLVHTLTQNVRGLPERSRDALGTNVVLDDTYDYDFNGNVAGITDGLPLAPGNRDMTYDALDRLSGVVAGAAQGGNGVFAYDPLDNLRVLDQGTRQYRYNYDTTGRLTTIKNPAGSTIFTFGYDGRGNQISRTGATFTFNRAERMTSTSLGSSSYVYDGLGRRVKATAGGLVTDSYYGSEGKLIFQRTPTKTIDFVYLAGSLVAERSVPIAGGGETRTFQHTDALGSPVAETSSTGALVGSRERLTAYGEPADGTYTDGPGFTGHVTDAASKLTYMQQRYYDPQMGRFLSIDPVAARPAGDNFNRYAYASNNPLKYLDPDGRENELGITVTFHPDFARASSPSATDTVILNAAQRSVDLTVNAVMAGSDQSRIADAKLWTATADPDLDIGKGIADTLSHPANDYDPKWIETTYGPNVAQLTDSKKDFKLSDGITSRGGDPALLHAGAHELAHGSDGNMKIDPATQPDQSEEDAGNRVMQTIETSPDVDEGMIRR